MENRENHRVEVDLVGHSQGAIVASFVAATAQADSVRTVVTLGADPFLGRLLTGRIESGKAVPGMAIHALDREGKEIERGRITKVLAFRGLKRQPLDEGSEAGDIVAIAGMSKATVADTIAAVGGTSSRLPIIDTPRVSLLNPPVCVPSTLRSSPPNAPSKIWPYLSTSTL